MAWSNSKVFGSFLEDLLNGTQAHDLNTDTFKVALYNNSITPDNTVATGALSTYNGAASQWLTTNEKSSTGQWASGGETLGSPSIARTNAVVTWDAADTASAAGATMSDIYGALVYNTSRSSRGVAYLYFGGGASGVSNGVFTVVWNSSGLATFTAS